MVYSGLVYAHFSGFGPKGPDAAKPGFDSTAFWLRSGPMADWQVPGSFPFTPTYAFGDMATSSAFLSGILMAIIGKKSTGMGTFVSTSLFAKTGALFFLTDVVIVIASAFVFRNVDKALYAGIVVIITSVVLDVVLYGRDEAKLIYIISDHSEKIAGRLLEELDIGVTYVQGSGAYSGKEKSVIMCAMKKNISPKAEEIVKEEDPLAFMIVTSATEIFGEGYKSYFSEKL